MSTFLVLCQRASKESGTVAAAIETVTGHTGWLDKIVGWVSDAWVDIQNSHESWRFLRKEFEAELTNETGAYTAASFGIENFGSWRNDTTRFDVVTLYDPDIGVADEGSLQFCDWDDFKRKFRRGSQTSNKPGYWSIDPEERFCVGPVPDKAYAIKGEYIRAPQVLTENDDVPICPERFHMVIVWYALVYLAEHDADDMFDLAAANRKYSNLRSDLERSQLPDLALGGPLA